MKVIIPMTKTSLEWLQKGPEFGFIFGALVCLALLPPKAFGVVPAPDGGYSGGNTAEGQNALLSLTSGIYNTALGFFSLKSDTAGNLNTAIGAGALFANTADNNTATGAGALFSNTTGADNTATGAFALFSNTTGVDNTATGLYALSHNTTGLGNTANGVVALVSNTEGNENTAVGDDTLVDNTTGNDNTATGVGALEVNTTGDVNTATGAFALARNTTGSNNTAIGTNALSNNTTGNNNIALGFNAGESQTTGSNNVYIGAGLVGVAGESNACYIGSIFGQTSGGGAPVLINATGKLGTTTSSKRFKEEIRPMDKTSEALFDLAPVTFRYKKEIDPKGTRQLGLVAEEVEQVNPDLVVRDKEGKPYSVRYDQVNAMLLNEFLKEHKTVQEQGATIAEFKKEITALSATVKEQASQIQRVTAQVEMSTPTAEVALNKP